MRFVKMHGLGNDFVIVDAVRQAIDLAHLRQTAAHLCDRHFGVGADGVIFVLPSRQADFQMRLINSDGSEGEMCGNGIRCLGKYVYESGLHREKSVAVETLAGIQQLQLHVQNRDAPNLGAQNGAVDSACVDMGEPRLSPQEIPTTLAPTGEWTIGDRSVPVVREASLHVNGGTFAVTCVSMGNPHCIVFREEVESFPFKEWGPKIEQHPVFPRRTNVHFVKVINRHELQTRVWERGAGPTLACGTGACASLVAGVINGRTDRQATVHLPGGTLEVEWKENNHLFMTGRAILVYEGEIEV